MARLYSNYLSPDCLNHTKAQPVRKVWGSTAVQRPNWTAITLAVVALLLKNLNSFFFLSGMLYLFIFRDFPSLTVFPLSKVFCVRSEDFSHGYSWAHTLK